MSREIDQRHGFHTVDTHHIGATFHAKAPQRQPAGLWARIKAWFIADDQWEPPAAPASAPAAMACASKAASAPPFRPA